MPVAPYWCCCVGGGGPAGCCDLESFCGLLDTGGGVLDRRMRVAGTVTVAGTYTNGSDCSYSVDHVYAINKTEVSDDQRPCVVDVQDTANHEQRKCLPGNEESSYYFDFAQCSWHSTGSDDAWGDFGNGRRSVRGGSQTMDGVKVVQNGRVLIGHRLVPLAFIDFESLAQIRPGGLTGWSASLDFLFFQGVTSSLSMNVTRLSPGCLAQHRMVIAAACKSSSGSQQIDLTFAVDLTWTILGLLGCDGSRPSKRPASGSDAPLDPAILATLERQANGGGCKSCGDGFQG